MDKDVLKINEKNRNTLREKQKKNGHEEEGFSRKKVTDGLPKKNVQPL